MWRLGDERWHFGNHTELYKNGYFEKWLTSTVYAILYRTVPVKPVVTRTVHNNGYSTSMSICPFVHLSICPGSERGGSYPGDNYHGDRYKQSLINRVNPQV